MSKRTSSPIYAEQAERIAHKLGATVDKSGSHIVALVYDGDVVVITFRWRHDKKAPNGHLPKQLKLSEHKTLEMARCIYSRDQYFEHLRKKGLLQASQ